MRIPSELEYWVATLLGRLARLRVSSYSHFAGRGYGGGTPLLSPTYRPSLTRDAD